MRHPKSDTVLGKWRYRNYCLPFERSVTAIQVPLT